MQSHNLTARMSFKVFSLLHAFFAKFYIQHNLNLRHKNNKFSNNFNIHNSHTNNLIYVKYTFRNNIFFLLCYQNCLVITMCVRRTMCITYIAQLYTAYSNLLYIQYGSFQRNHSFEWRRSTMMATAYSIIYLIIVLSGVKYNMHLFMWTDVCRYNTR